MKEFTYQEKIAMMRILLDIIHADGRIDARETFFFNQLKNLFHMDDADHKVVEDKNSLLALAQINSLDNDKKEYFAKLMSKMIVVDEDINVNEVAIFNLVCDFCSIKVKFEDTISNDNSYTNS